MSECKSNRKNNSEGKCEQVRVSTSKKASMREHVGEGEIV